MSRAAAVPFASAALAAPRRARTPGLVARLVAWSSLRRSRLSLASLDAHLLRDVGLTAEQAREEASRPSWETVWDAPVHWLR